MSTIYHDGSRQLQDRFDTRRLADRIEEALVHDFVSPHDAAFIEQRDMFFIATADEQGRPKCSYKGGDPGFVRVVDERTLAFPNYNGNGMYLSMGNLLKNPHVGLLFIDFERGNRMRVNGVAHVDEHDQLSAEYPEAQLSFGSMFKRCSRTARATSIDTAGSRHRARRADQPRGQLPGVVAHWWAKPTTLSWHR